MFISSLILSTASGAECPDGDDTCVEEAPLAILEPTKSPGALANPPPAEKDEDKPPLVILAPIPVPVTDDDVEIDEVPEEGVIPYDDVVVVTDEDTKKIVERRRGPELLGQYAMQFIDGTPAHQFQLRHYGRKDAYLGAELRYLPQNDAILWSGRVSAGFDFLGASPFDVQLGLFLGSAGEWFIFEDNDQLALYHSPILGTEVRIGYQGRKLFTSYRWLGGVGVGPLEPFLREREFTLGYKITPTLQVLGQAVRLDPRSDDSQWGLGLGVRIAL